MKFLIHCSAFLFFFVGLLSCEKHDWDDIKPLYESHDDHGHGDHSSDKHGDHSSDKHGTKQLSQDDASGSDSELQVSPAKKESDSNHADH